MVYTPKEKQRMDRLFHAFSDYVRTHRFMDIAYTDKSGFVWLSVGEATDYLYSRIPDFDYMLKMFVDSYMMDEETRTGSYMRLDYNRLRSLLSPRFATLGDDAEYCLRFMEEHLEKIRKWHESLYLQQQQEDAQLRKLLADCPEYKCLF